MRIITTTGCYGTGSSAITDFIKEFDGISCAGEYEVRFLHDPDGISDLEYSIIENPNRHNSSNSVKRFLRMMKDLDHVYFIKRYSKYFGNSLMKCVENYIKEIIELEYYGMWHQDIIDRGKIFYLLSRSSSHISWFLHNHFSLPTTSKRALIPDDEKAYLPTTDETLFLNATRKFVDSIARLIDKESNNIVFFDQLVPPSNLERYIRYCNNIRIVIVERDPRDIYILEKYIWKGRVAPHNNVEDFCKWYSWTRGLYRKTKLPSEVLFVQFEDFIFDYDNIANMLIKHFDLNDYVHRNKYKFFNPKKSMNNVCLWEKYPSEKDNISYIKRELKEYCYAFDEKTIIHNQEERIF